MFDPVNISEPVSVATYTVDGVAQMRVDRHGIARMVLYADQLEVDGSTSSVVVARLTMRHSAMVEVGEAMMMAYTNMPATGRNPYLHKLT